MNWRIHHQSVTTSTNLDARVGQAGDVFTADYQTAGRGRLNHTWHAAAGQNLIMSVVWDVADCSPQDIAPLPLVMGLAVMEGLATLVPADYQLKWPNDIWVNGRKLAGILCERHGDCVIVGLGVNVREVNFPAELQERATSLALLGEPIPEVTAVRDAILGAMSRVWEDWRAQGFEALLPRLTARDALKGRIVSVFVTDTDAAPITGRCGGIQPDGSLLVGTTPVYAGEAHVQGGSQ